MKRVGIIGFGRIGTALAVSLKKCGYEVEVVRRNQKLTKTNPVSGKTFNVISLEEAASKMEVIFITTPDDNISDTALKLAKMDLGCKAVLHMSGSLSSELLDFLRKKNIFIGSLHPLQSFPNVEQAVSNFPGSFFTYEGDKALLPWIKEIVAQLGGVLKTLPSLEMKVIYHAGAVFVSNYMVALTSLGISCLKRAGFKDDEAREALLPLMKGTMNNLAGMPSEKALTGPVSRGDTGVIASHLQVLQNELPEALPAYCDLAEVLASISEKSGKISAEKKEELINLIKGGVWNE